MFQIMLTPAAGKRLIAKAMLEHEAIKKAIFNGTIVIIAGTTNGYVAEEILSALGQSKDFKRNRFFRGVTVSPAIKTTDTGRLPDEFQFPGDVVISNRVWQKGKTIFDVIEELKEGDVIVKGANCVDPVHKKAGILIGHPKGGTAAIALQAVVGRRVKLILPVGLEKRVSEDIDAIAAMLNKPGATGSRLLPVPGEILTEIEAMHILFGVKTTLVAGGGVDGAEGAVWLAIDGDKNQSERACAFLKEIEKEAPFEM